jgi:hypothetical protein
MNPEGVTFGNRLASSLVDAEELVDVILARYEQFDPAYKAQLPLLRVHVPDVSETED